MMSVLLTVHVHTSSYHHVFISLSLLTECPSSALDGGGCSHQQPLLNGSIIFCLALLLHNVCHHLYYNNYVVVSVAHSQSWIIYTHTKIERHDLRIHMHYQHYPQPLQQCHQLWNLKHFNITRVYYINLHSYTSCGMDHPHAGAHDMQDPAKCTHEICVWAGCPHYSVKLSN